MPEPLSVAAGVAGLLALAVQTTKILHDQIKTIKNAPMDAKQLLHELDTLVKVLTNLDNLLKAQPGSDSTFKQTSILVGTIRECRDQITNLKARIGKFEQSKGVVKLIERGKWLYKHDEHVELMKAMHRFVSLFQMSLSTDGLVLLSKTAQDVTDNIRMLKSATAALRSISEDTRKGADQLDDIQQLLSPVSYMHEQLTEVVHRIKTQEENSNELRNREILDWLSPLNFWKKHEDIKAKRARGTGGWIVEDPVFKEWEAGTERTLWCPGMPGAGKTVLASVVVDHLQKIIRGEEEVVLFLYCDYKDSAAQTISAMIGSMAQQYLSCMREFPSEAHMLYEKHLQKKTRPNTEELLNLLKRVTMGSKRVYVVVDALDEFDNIGRQHLISNILALPLTVSLIVTSRELSMIGEELGKHRRLDILACEADIKNYIESYIRQEARLSRHVKKDPSLETAIKEKISLSAGNIFLLAELHMKSISTKHTPKAVRAGLEDLPNELDLTYDDAMLRILSQNKDDALLAERVLRWLSFAFGPLSIRELQQAIAIEDGDNEIEPEDLCDDTIMTSVCGGLVKVDEASDEVRLIHITVQEYFERNTSKHFPQSDLSIGFTCIKFFSLDAFASGRATSDALMNERLSRYPFLRYAARYWAHHCSAKHEITLSEAVSEFLCREQHLSSLLQASYVTLLHSEGLYAEVFPLETDGLGAAAFFGLKRSLQLLLKGIANDTGKRHSKSCALLNAVSGMFTNLFRNFTEFGAAERTITMERRVKIFVNITSRDYGGIIRLLLDNGAAADAKNARGEMAIHIAAQMIDPEPINILLNHGVDVNARSSSGSTALHFAARPRMPSLNTQIIKFILDKGAEVEARDANNFTPLHLAAQYDHAEMVELLIERRVDVNASICVRDSDNGGPLDEELDVEEEEEQEMSAEDEEEEEEGEEQGGTALHLAVKAGHKKVVHKLLAAKGARTDVYDKRLRTPLHLAAYAGHKAITQLLLDHHAETNKLDKEDLTPLHLAAQAGHKDIVRLLLRKGATMDALQYGGDGRTPLIYAPSRGSRPMTQLSLRKGVNVNESDFLGRTALHFNYEPVVRELTKLGIGIEDRRYDGLTALHIAAAKGHEGVVTALIEGGCAIEALTREDKLTAVQLAKQNGHMNVAQRLLDSGAVDRDLPS